MIPHGWFSAFSHSAIAENRAAILGLIYSMWTDSLRYSLLLAANGKLSSVNHEHMERFLSDKTYKRLLLASIHPANDGKTMQPAVISAISNYFIR